MGYSGFLNCTFLKMIGCQILGIQKHSMLLILETLSTCVPPHPQEVLIRLAPLLKQGHAKALQAQADFQSSQNQSAFIQAARGILREEEDRAQDKGTRSVLTYQVLLRFLP